MNVFEDDDHSDSTGGGDETVVKAIPFDVDVDRSVLNSLPVSHLNYSKDKRMLFQALHEEVVCLHDDLCIGIAGISWFGGIRNGWPFVLYRGDSGHRPEKVYLHDGL